MRSGESYGTMNSLETHFGIASETTITRIVVRWPSGLVDELVNPAINQSHLIVEGSNPLSTEEVTADTFEIYPNPAQDMVTINATSIGNNIEISLYDISGKLVMSDEFIALKEKQLDISSLKSGLYFLHMSSDQQKYVYKLIKR